MIKKIHQFGLHIIEKFPVLTPILEKVWKKLPEDYRKSVYVKFAGWGMTTQHENAWNDKFSCSVFRQTCIDLEKFNFTPSTRFTKESIYEHNWRHYFISFSTLYAIKFAQGHNYNFVECGVADGVTAFVTLNELSNKLGSNFKMHLYDAWSAMKKDSLLDSELQNEGHYFDLSISRTKSNLKEFEQNIIYHEGIIPTIFNQLPKSPESIAYLHIDINSAKPTLDVLNFFFPKLVSGGIIIFDDYGWKPYHGTKNVVDEFFSNKNGIIQKLPTGQAIYFHNLIS